MFYIYIDFWCHKAENKKKNLQISDILKKAIFLQADYGSLQQGIHITRQNYLLLGLKNVLVKTQVLP